MGTPIKYEHFLQQFAALSESDAEVAIKAVGTDRRYRLEIAGLVVAYLFGMVAVSLTVSAFYRTYQTSSSFKSDLAIALIVGVVLSAVLLRLMIHQLYWRAVARQIKMVKDVP